MTSLDDKLVPKALSLIDDFGQNATFQTVTRTYDPTTGTTTESSSVDVVRKISPPSPYVKEFDSASLTERAEMQCLVAASGLTFTPALGMDMVLTDSTRWQIVGVYPIYSGASLAAYTLLLGR